MSHGDFKVETENVPHEELMRQLATVFSGKEMQVTGNHRQNILTENALISLHDDGRLTDEDVTVVLFVTPAESGGEFVLHLRPEENAVIILPAKAVHGVLEVVKGERVSITATLTPKEK